MHHITILEELEIKTHEEDAEDVPQSLEDGGQSTVDELKEVNLGTIEEPRPEYKDIFAWSYQEMPELDLKAQEEKKGNERALYYLSRTLVGAKVNYSPIEKMCLALFFAIDKLRHYMQAFTVHLVANVDPIKYAIKGQALADFLADHPIPSYWKLCEDLPDDEVFFMKVMKPWTMYFDGVVRRSGAGADIILISPEKHMLPYSFALVELCSNNVAKYQALDNWPSNGIRDWSIIYKNLWFDGVMLEHVPRTENKRADTLANLATALTMSDDVALNIPLCQ
ncbi:uncharacterized protein E5676_scaffold523G00210 [Cucumis melo var. makuwa]|uniref:Reverse transcriptase RNase H-like domain-containing protein n=1 Tax=Cucumis melo var. makuwa TaxID=1194695 RepID=A0A5D3DGY8_CUCMM|nr:uncharacterized protein E6C27_scaffold382G00710 [Cucumis melo var. makuwa]TYK22539.1 uncharacterized protein E5676_scaffold523G00210 [Cucumis melo var. makuwa]